MKARTILLSPVAVDDDIVAVSQTPAGAGTLTLTGTALDYARQLGIYSASDISNRTFDVVGTYRGQVISETGITGPNNETVETTKYFDSVTSITISGAAAGAVKVGTVDELVSQPVPIDRYRTSHSIGLVLTGTINVTVQAALENIQTTSLNTITWYDHTTLASQTASASGNYTSPITAVRLKVNSYSSGATAQITINTSYD